MNKVLAVARWEYLEKVKSKAFLIGLLLTPLIMVGMGVLPGLFVTQEDAESRVIGIIDGTGQFGEEFARRMQTRYTLNNGQPNYIVLPLAIGTKIDEEGTVAEANRKVREDGIEGYCLVRATGAGDTTAEYRSRSVGDLFIVSRMKETLRDIMTERRVSGLGLDPSILKKIEVDLDVEVVKLTEEGETEEGGFAAVFYSAYIFLMMLFFLIVTSGQLLVRSVIEEKSNRIVEVLVSSCSSSQLMAGKVLGLSGLGLTQMGFWALIGVVVSFKFGVQLIGAGDLGFLVLYFILGYLLYAAIFIAAGSPLSTEQEAQQVTSYLVMLLIIPLVLAIPVMKDPGAVWIKVLSFIPLLTPTMMAMRIPIQRPEWWEILATMFLMILSIVGAMIAAGRVFRIGILATGKSPKLAEILRWIKTG